ncbi:MULTISPECIES: protoporphyrinogen oxidase [Arthrobacter]|uniref:Coproporphyrinogen III oxidase n=1 Tax=Arthrobacter caoxuetaonis TaxID=2886935 RepID=A0A9X1SBS4_9MICC|nr:MULTISPECIES: protoporphyrinogen oxidase [Arthrobacter]MCC3281036.1 protoporphyrinogen oxidase [Arthrobacter caoxuetaonis]MCC3296712.1 protoporphyrinogen oxidase [Arthrobacter caoxuetaonis]MCC9192802.1 protoporphyrinogen oxidase [Arthrobacter sp. zg-Y916]USQ56466.1 protoporphyrinogen oxidase [Arthrobacter caoxuetaonis]
MPAAAKPETPYSRQARRAVVVGGGISGLIAARDLAREGLEVTVLEAAEAFGGCVGTHRVAGLNLDSGAESYASRSGAVPALIGELGLAEDIVQPDPAGAWLQLGGPDLAQAAQRMPQSGLLGIPADPRAEEIAKAIGRVGVARASLDRVLPMAPLLRKEKVSLGEVVRSRMGEPVLKRLVSPVVGGVYSADPDVLDVDSVAPGLRKAMAEHGSLSAAVGAMRKAAPAGSTVASLKGGMGTLTQALCADLRQRGATLLAGTPVTGIERTADGFRVAAGDLLEADAVVVAADGPTAVDLLAPSVPGLSDFRPGPGPGVALVTLVVDRPELDAKPRGTGVLVALDAVDVQAKALTHATAKWQWLADSTGPGTHVLRLSYGRGLGPGQSADTTALRPDEDLFAAALADASALLQVPLEETDVIGWDVVRWVGALPSASVGHAERVMAVRAAVAEVHGLEVVGAWLAGTGLAAVTADTRYRAKHLAEAVKAVE